ncbi:MAG: YchE family NAAT transporter [Desulfobacteraceae bacterium]|nr:YchE family NAAT transporter [Desulfobacteraceae bacterium]
MIWKEYLKFFIGLIAIVNPLGAIPIFIALTAGLDRSDRRRVSRMASVAVAAILLAALLVGEAILRFFGISIPSFQVAGGLLILLMAISMMHGRPSRVQQTEEEARDAEEMDSVAVMPLGIPLLAGPGAISTIILYVHRSRAPWDMAILALEILVVSLAVWLCLRSAPFIARFLSRTGINIATRIMGLIMAAIGIEFIATGLKQLFPILS